MDDQEHSVTAEGNSIHARFVPGLAVVQNRPAISIKSHRPLPPEDIQSEACPTDALSIQRSRNEAAIRLLEEWMADQSGYDEETWPIVKKAIEENRPSYRQRFYD